MNQQTKNPCCRFGQNRQKCNVTTAPGESPNPSLHADGDGGLDALRLVTASHSGGVSVCGDAVCDGVKQLAVRAEAQQTRRAAFTDSKSDLFSKKNQIRTWNNLQMPFQLSIRARGKSPLFCSRKTQRRQKIIK